MRSDPFPAELTVESDRAETVVAYSQNVEFQYLQLAALTGIQMIRVGVVRHCREERVDRILIATMLNTKGLKHFEYE